MNPFSAVILILAGLYVLYRVSKASVKILGRIITEVDFSVLVKPLLTLMVIGIFLAGGSLIFNMISSLPVPQPSINSTIIEFYEGFDFQNLSEIFFLIIPVFFILSFMISTTRN